MAERIAILVTGAGGPLGVNVTRSLSESGLRARTIGTDANRWHLPLSLCDATYLIPRAVDRPGYAAAMTEIARREAIDVIVPTHPVEVRAVASLRDRGELAGMATALPSTAVIERCDDKLATQQTLAAAGIAVPRTIAIAQPADIDRAFGELGSTVWLRGTGAPGLGLGGAALPCSDRGVAHAWVTHHHGWGKMAASELLPGRNLTWMAAFQHGVLIAAAARERLEYVLPHVSPSGITGAPAVTCTVRRADIELAGEASVRALDPAPHGVYFVDLKEDRAGLPCVTEINAGRCGTTVQFYTRAGCNFPELLVQIARDEVLVPLPDPNAAVPAGLYWVRTLDCGPELVREEEFDRYPRAGFPE